MVASFSPVIAFHQMGFFFIVAFVCASMFSAIDSPELFKPLRIPTWNFSVCQDFPPKLKILRQKSLVRGT
jgi:hypothetical protein